MNQPDTTNKSLTDQRIRSPSDTLHDAHADLLQSTCRGSYWTLLTSYYQAIYSYKTQMVLCKDLQTMRQNWLNDDISKCCGKVRPNDVTILCRNIRNFISVVQTVKN